MESRRKFQQELNSLHRRTRHWLGWQGTLRVCAVAGPMLGLTLWTLGGEIHPGAVLTGGLVLSFLAALVALIWTQLISPWLRLRRARDLVAHVEKEGQFSNLLVSAEESLRLPERWDSSEAIGQELQARVFQQARGILGFLTPARIAPFSYTRTALVVSILAGLSLLLMAVMLPDSARRGWSRLLDPWPSAIPLKTQGLYPDQARREVVVGRDIDLSVVDFAGGEGPAECEIRTGQGLWQTLPTQSVAVPRPEPYLPSPYRQWSASVAEVREDFAWRFRRGSLISKEGQVRVRHYPMLKSLAGIVTPPAYTGLADQQMDRFPSWLEVPAGSRLHIQGVANHDLTGAYLLSDEGDSLSLQVSDATISGQRLIKDDLKFQVVLRDSFGLGNQAPITYEISALPDAEPEIQMSRPNDNGLLPLDGLVTLLTESRDDYGLDFLDIQLRVKPGGGFAADNEDDLWQNGRVWTPDYPESRQFTTAEGEVSVAIENLGQDRSNLQVLLGLDLDLSQLQLLAGDVLEIRLAGRDNKRPGTGQTGYSSILRLALPSAADVLASQAEASEERRGELEEVKKRGQELGADLDRLNRELMKNPIPDWARQKEMQQAIDRQKGLQEELARLSQELQKDLDRLAAGQMTSEAMLEKAEEVSQLLSQSPQESLQDLLDKMDQAADKTTAQEMAQAIREVAKNQKDMARRLDAALAMLKRMEQEQDMEGLASLLEQMIRKQQELADQSRQLAEQNEAEGGEPDSSESESSQESPDSEGESPDQDTNSGQENSGEESASEELNPEEMARRQEALAEELDQLQEKLEQALEKLEEEQSESGPSESDEKMEQALKEALENLEKQKQQGDMQKASEQLSEMDPGEAAEMQQQALRDLGALYHVILESQQAMQMAMEQNQISSLRQLAADMLSLSARQELIAGQVPAQLRDVRSLELTRSQHRLQRSATGVRDRLNGLLDQAPTRIMRLLGKLDGLIEQMGHVVQAMEDNRAPVAKRSAKASLAEANRIVIGLLTEAQITSQSSSGGSGQQQSMSQQLQQMAQEQAKLNGMTQQLRQMLANRGMSQEARSQMKRLGEAQGNLAGKMGELDEKERESAEGERLLGDLRQLGQQMERISGELDDGLVSEETLIRQERILSRMLDARNSVRRRDYTTRRESRTADQLYGKMEGGGGPDEDGSRDREFRLRYQTLEKAPVEYRDLVRRYFTALDSLRRLDPESLISPGNGADTQGRDLP